MRASNRQSSGVFLRVVIFAVISTFVVVAAPVVGIILPPSPRVGDIVTFTPDGFTGKGDRILVHRPGALACMLDLGLMGRGGGSVVVEQRIPGAEPTYRLHWAGPRTSADAADCGTSAELLLGERDVQALAAVGVGAPEIGVPAYGEGVSR